MSMSKLVIANWKSQKTKAGLLEWWNEFIADYSPAENCLVAVAPPVTLLHTLREFTAPIESIQLAAQDVSPYPMGAYTGAINAEQLSDLHVKYVIVGHSERRRHFHETHEDVARKVTEVCNAGMTPVLCLDKEYIGAQFNALSSDVCSSCVIAYEPLSAIGSGHNEDVGTVQKVITQIRSQFGAEVPVLYGGSVTPENIGEYVLVCDGALVGGASLDGKKFARLTSKVL